jgi:hypothetical protein
MENFSTLPSGKYTIAAPEVLCFYNSDFRSDTLEYFSIIEKYPKSKSHFITLDFTELKLMTAAVATYMFAMVSAQQIYISNNYFNLKLPRDKSAKELLIKSGLHVALKKGGTAKFKRLWKTSSFLCGNQSNATKFLEVLRSRSSVSPLPTKLSGAFKDAFININHHAYGGPTSILSTTWWCYFYTKTDDTGRYLVAIIIDRGIGIPNKIKNKFPLWRLHEDKDCISHAMTESVTTTNEKGRGKGSKCIKKPIELNTLTRYDNLLILSGDGMFKYTHSHNKEKIITRSLDYTFKGTLIEWKLYY